MTSKLLRTLLAGSSLALLAAAAPAAAQSANATFQVSANVLKTCTIAATPIDFGDYDPVGANDVAPADQTGTVTIRCTRGTAWSVTLDDGLSGSRQMQFGAEPLAYQLYSDSSRTVVWDGAAPVAGTAASRAPVALIVYGRVPGGQDAVPGVYLDTVAATINF